MNVCAKHILVKGDVQGVFFRKYTKQKAEELNIKGWVKNTEDGNVEIFAQGDEKEIAQLTKWCWQGSPKAEVLNVIISEGQIDNELKNFYIDR